MFRTIPPPPERLLVFAPVPSLPFSLHLRGLNRLGVLIAETMLDNFVLYRFKPNDLRNAEGLGYKPGAVTVTSRGIEVTLAPLR